MSLGPRQRIAYRHTVNLWQPTRVINSTTGAVGAETYALAYSGVPALFSYTDNVSDSIEGAGRTKRPTIFTTDMIAFDAAQEIAEGWIVKNVSLLPDGSQSPLYGDFHRVLGAARVTPNTGNRRANKLKVMAQSIEKVPSGVS